VPLTDDGTTFTKGTVERFDNERGGGINSGDDGAPRCAAHADTARGIASPATGNCAQFRPRSQNGEGAAIDLTLLRAEQRWENEGGAVESGDP
jgi:cold shock CspA family protein